jgi:anti-anti-sigma factor
MPIAKFDLMIDILQSADQVALKGSLTVDTVSSAFARSPQFNEGSTRIDLSGIDEMDSAGLSLLVYWRQQSEMKNCELIFLNPSPQIVTMSRISGLESLIRP